MQWSSERNETKYEMKKKLNEQPRRKICFDLSVMIAKRSTSHASQPKKTEWNGAKLRVNGWTMNVWCFRNNLSKICLWAVLTLFFLRVASSCGHDRVWVCADNSHSLDVALPHTCRRTAEVLYLFFPLPFIVSMFTFAFVCSESMYPNGYAEHWCLHIKK